MSNGLAVGMIHVAGDPTSNYYKKIVSQSWLNAGHNVMHFNGITPDTFDQAPMVLNFGKKKNGRNIGKNLTPTEKAIWYSHIMMWDMASKKSGPLIVIEHDVLMLKPYVHSTEYPIVGLCHCGLLSKKPERGYRISAGGAYLITAGIAKQMIRELPETINYNSDAYIHNYITKYGTFKHEHSTQLYLPEIGSTIDHG